MSGPIIICNSVEAAVEVSLSLERKRKEEFVENSKNDCVPTKGLKRKLEGPTSHDHKRSNYVNIDAPFIKEMKSVFIGDSIAVRLARQMGARIVKNMSLCHGGLTFEKLQENVSRCVRINENVIIICGMNNALQNKAVSTGDLHMLITTLKQKGANKIYFCTVPPICRDLTKNEAILSVNETILKMNNSDENICVIGIYNLFLKEDNSVDADLYKKFHYFGKPDLIHPNGKGLHEIAEELKKTVKNFSNPFEALQQNNAMISSPDPE